MFPGAVSIIVTDSLLFWSSKACTGSAYDRVQGHLQKQSQKHGLGSSKCKWLLSRSAGFTILYLLDFISSSSIVVFSSNTLPTRTTNNATRKLHHFQKTQLKKKEQNQQNVIQTQAFKVVSPKIFDQLKHFSVIWDGTKECPKKNKKKSNSRHLVD